jgi:3-methyladenine DNA glycosylase/8-oxoguanine DNA glycosylase
MGQDYAVAVRHLRRADPVLRRVIQRLGPCALDEERERNQFGALVDSILYQQLAYAAAKTIAGRFRKLFGDGRGRLPRPEELLCVPRHKLRAAGVSRQKIGYLRDLARKSSDGALRVGRYARIADEEVIENLTQVKGIGRWTAEMFLIFSLGRLDVLPVDDLGLQYGFKEAYGMRALPAAPTMQQLAEPWRPYRTVGTWYLWKLRRMGKQGKSEK